MCVPPGCFLVEEGGPGGSREQWGRGVPAPLQGPGLPWGVGLERLEPLALDLSEECGWVGCLWLFRGRDLEGKERTQPGPVPAGGVCITLVGWVLTVL